MRQIYIHPIICLELLIVSLLIAFIELKRTGIINWNWFLVFSPALIPLLVLVVCLLLVTNDKIWLFMNRYCRWKK